MEFNNIHKSYLFSFFANLQFIGALAIPFFLDWAKIDYTRAFIVEAWFSFWVFALEVPTGVVADKYGRKYSLALGGLFWVLGCLLFGSTKNYPLFFVADFLLAVSIALVSGADRALLYDSLKEMKKEKEAKVYFSRQSAAGTLGMVLGLPIGSMIAGSGILPYPRSIPFTFTLTSISGVLMVIFALAMREPKRHKPSENPLRMGLDGFRQILKNKKLSAFAFNSSLISASVFFMFWFYQSLAGRAGIDIKYYGFIGAAINLFSVFLLLNVRRLEDIMQMKNLLLFSALIPGILFIAVGFLGNPLLVVVCILLISGLRLMREPVLQDFMNRLIKSRDRATVLSGVSMLERIAIFVMYPFVGLLADVSLTLVLVFLGVMTLIFTAATRIETSHLD